ncbi:probable DNA replication complex GINS protein PSF2 [Anthonomus grandis grandis]|uniref:probable DNA replication complex GINS protein PSF2 n=1 Tax=Anthonomus grandis grandis TaxID=2921223 RepID=UPI0021653491|nr:probable DNA replication complex GINS protein PSF2 [Anthonomus grandis grandis]
MDPDEVEFWAEKTPIQIVPTFNSKPIFLIGGDVGPFRASIPINVPLWLAINLKKQQQCKIIPPDWMDVDHLTELKESEKIEKSLIKMPSEHYMVEAKLILGNASDDIPRADEIRTIIKDIWDIRMSKLRSSMDSMVKNVSMYAAIDNITFMEMNSIRPLLPHALDQVYRIKISKKGPGRTQGSSTFSHSRTATSFTT